MNGLRACLNRAGDLSSGNMEILKWFAVAMMMADHVNLFLLDSRYPLLFIAGRFALPIFVWLLASNLARQMPGDTRLVQRILGRLLPCLVIAELPYRALNYAQVGWLPLNVLTTLAVGVAVIGLLETGLRLHRWLALLLFAVSGLVIDYGWAGSALMVSSWALLRWPDRWRFLAFLASMLWISWVNTTAWAFAAILPILVISRCKLQFPRWRNALYWVYPLHLAIIALLKTPLFLT